MRYTVTWGDATATVYADSEAAAWSAFVAGNDVAYRCPQLYERTIEVIDENEVADPDLGM